jgi:hypothetical protein
MRGNPIVIYNEKMKPHSWCRWAVNRVKNKNNSTNIRIIGDTGSGKSWSALAISEIMADMEGKIFEPDDIYFSISDVIRKVNSDNPPPPGTIFFIDEQQIEGASGEFNNLRGKAYVSFFSTVRSRRYIIISTMPFADMVVKKVRRFFHVEIETLYIDESNKSVVTKPRLLDYHKHMDKIYRKMLIAGVRNPVTNKRKFIKIATWAIPKPNDELIEAYEEKKLEFQKLTYNKLVKDLDKFENKIKPEEEEKKSSPQEVLEKLTPYQRDLYNEIAEHPDYTLTEISNILLSKGHHSSQAKVSMNIGFMKRKGVIIARRRSGKNK